MFFYFFSIDTPHVCGAAKPRSCSTAMTPRGGKTALEPSNEKFNI
jgi:hypothetical protein